MKSTKPGSARKSVQDWMEGNRPGTGVPQRVDSSSDISTHQGSSTGTVKEVGAQMKVVADVHAEDASMDAVLNKEHKFFSSSP